MSDVKVEPLCLWCKHFSFYAATPDYSEETPADAFSIYCNRVKWRFKPYGTEEEFRNCIVAAQTCPDYEFK